MLQAAALGAPDRFRTFERASRGAAFVALTIAVVVLVGWSFDVEALKRILPAFSTMKVNTAICAALSGVALFLATTERTPNWVPAAIAAAVLLVAGLTLYEYVAGSSLGIDEMLFADLDSVEQPGRMAPASASSFIALAAAIVFLRSRVAFAHAIAGLVFVVGLVAVLGYLFGVEGLHTLSSQASIALPTALAQIALSLGVLAAFPSRGLTAPFANDGAAGHMMRRVLPAAVLLPIFIGWAIVQGERVDLYENRFTTALVVVVTVVLLGLVLLRSAHHLLAVDMLRAQAVRELRTLNVELEQRIAARTAALAESEEFFRAIAENVGDVIIRMDAEGKITYASPAARATLGYEPEELLRRTMMDLVLPEGKAEIQRVYGRVLNAESATTRQQLRRADGSPVWMEGIASPVNDPSTGFLRSIIWVVRDVSAHVAELEREQEIAAREQGLNQLKNEFVAIVAHDLRSPITVIGGFAEVMLASWDTLGDEQRLDFIERIRDNASRLEMLVDDVLQVSLMETDVALDLRPIDLGRLIDRTVEEIRSVHPQRQIVVTRPPDLPTVLADEDRQWRVLSNLLSNALKFSEDDQPVEVRLALCGDEVQVSVSDRGGGILPEDLPKLFQRFSRVQQPAGKEVKGTGLGLYISKTLVEAQGGRIWAESEPGEGTTFHYTVPVAAGERP